LDWYAGLLTRDKVVPPSAPSDGFRQIMEAFNTGQTAMLWGHTGNLMEIASRLEPGVEFGTVPRPAGPAQRVARLNYLYNGMMKSDNADASWEWIKFWGETDTAVAFLEKTGYFPANSQAAQDERIVGNPIYAAAVETLGYGVAPPSFPGLAQFMGNVLLPVFQRVLIGEATAAEAVDEMIAGLAEATA
jgi:multiple sugar transport system substrate-binding protein